MEQNELRLEVLMSCMHQEDFSIAYKTKIDTDLLIINQCDRDDYQEMVVNGHLWRMISTTERGLAKSRNMAMANAKGTVCLLCDDDEIMEDDYEQTILDAYRQLPKASAIVFNLHRVNYKMKKRYYIIPAVRRAPAYRGYSSQMLTMRIEDIRRKNLRMNEKFGSGTQWGGGEETLFEHHIRKAGLRIYENPGFIATIDYSGGSAWFVGYNEKYFYNLGAYMQYRDKCFLTRELRFCYEAFYKLRKEKTLTPFQKLHWLHLGVRGMRKDVTYSQFMERSAADK